ncbi:hypothetical protein Bca101_098088 [Brassica carinata]
MKKELLETIDNKRSHGRLKKKKKKKVSLDKLATFVCLRRVCALLTAGGLRLSLFLSLFLCPTPPSVHSPSACQGCKPWRVESCSVCSPVWSSMAVPGQSCRPPSHPSSLPGVPVPRSSLKLPACFFEVCSCIYVFGFTFCRRLIT